jgi:hypothetical protein
MYIIIVKHLYTIYALIYHLHSLARPCRTVVWSSQKGCVYAWFSSLHHPTNSPHHIKSNIQMCSECIVCIVRIQKNTLFSQKRIQPFQFSACI